MAMHINLSGKHLKIDKANNAMFVAVAVASVISIFCLVSAKALFSQAAHQRQVINTNNASAKQQNKNLDVAKNLKDRFDIFNQANPNVLGGNSDNSSTGPVDGDNARIVLDALPSQYDFPALISSMEKVLTNNGIQSPAVTGTDQSDTNSNDAKASPSPTIISLTVGGTSNYQAVQNFIGDLERSIRPFDLTTLELDGNNANLKMTVAVNTYYQQAKSLDNGKKVIK